MRVTPAGGRVVRFLVECGEPLGPLVLPVVVTGEALVETAARLRKGQRIRTSGSLRAIAAAARRVGRSKMENLGVELMASTLDADGSTE